MKNKVKNYIRNLIPNAVLHRLGALRKNQDIKTFNSIKRANCSSDNLKKITDVSLYDILNSKEICALFDESKEKINELSITEKAYGVNRGDCRAIYYLISYFNPSTILEVGTHIGASTSYIASAFMKNKCISDECGIVSVDINDVNSSSDKPWIRYGSTYSPAEIMQKIGCERFVKFITSPSLDYLKNTKSTFDFIFLDGDHSASTVYQEVPLALKLLNKNGVILLHDHYPKEHPLWAGNYGPNIAVKRLIDEGLNAQILPLGDLPWPTKNNSNFTSLTLLLKKN